MSQKMTKRMTAATRRLIRRPEFLLPAALAGRSRKPCLSHPAAVGRVDNKETRREYNLALGIRNLALIRASRGTNLPKRSDRPVQRAGRANNDGVFHTISQPYVQFRILG